MECVNICFSASDLRAKEYEEKNTKTMMIIMKEKKKHTHIVWMDGPGSQDGLEIAYTQGHYKRRI